MQQVLDKPIIVTGAGGHAKVVAQALRLLGREIIGFTTPDLEAGTVFCGSIVLGSDTKILEIHPKNIELANGIGMLPRGTTRRDVAGFFRQKKYRFNTLVHPNAEIASDVVLQEGVQVMAGVIIQAGTVVDQDTIVNTGVVIDHDCTIGPNCHLAPAVVCCGGVIVERNAFIGTGSNVIQNVNIGEGSIVAAGTTVFRDVPPNVMVKQVFETDHLRIEN